MRNYIVYIVSAIVLNACIEPYEFSEGETVEVLVVDAVFTNEQKSHQVKLSTSGGLVTYETRPVSDASVWIIEGEGVQIDLMETDSGIYETASTVQGIIGQSYTLFIKLQDGTMYSSTTESLPAPIAMDSIYGRYMEIPSTEDDQILQGVQLFVDTHNEASEFSNFRYEYIEDYEIRVTYASQFGWNTTTQSSFPRSTSVSVCYGHQESVELITATTNGQSQNRLAEFPIRMIGIEEEQLNHRYSITVDQYTISSKAYQYYKSLKENNESSGSFFDQQKGSVPGNITNRSDLGDPVLGYFEVSGVSSKTDFFVPFEFEGLNLINSRCEYEDIVDSVNVALLNNDIMFGKNIYDFTFPSRDTAILIPNVCSDCRYRGDIQKPDFWD